MVWAVMKETPHHTYQILTKRPERMAEVLGAAPFEILPNVWLGVSIEDGSGVNLLQKLIQEADSAALQYQRILTHMESLLGRAQAGEDV